MSHELSIKDNGEAEMMFNKQSGSTWHGLGTPVDGLATTAEAIEAAHLNWEMVKKPVLHQLDDGTYEEIDNNFALTRVDTQEVFDIVSDNYSIFQNKDAFTFMDKVLQDVNGPHIDTCGALYGGRKVWISCKFPDSIEVVNTDIINKYLLLSSSHDRSTPIKVVLTTVRTVCRNTHNVAMRTGDVRFKQKHSGDLMAKISNVQEALGIMNESFDAYADTLKALTTVHPTPEQIDKIMVSLFPLLQGEDGKGKTQAENSVSRILHYYENGLGQDIPGVSGTGYALLNGLTEWSDTEKMMNTNKSNLWESKWESAMIGREAAQKVEAFNTICNVLLL